MEKNIKVNAQLIRIEKFLNSSIKNRKENEFGYITIHYARIHKGGCCVRMHHWHNNTLCIDLLITENEQKKYPGSCESAIVAFKSLFKDRVQYDSEFYVNNKPNSPYKRYWIDVTPYSDDYIFDALEKIQTNFKGI